MVEEGRKATTDAQSERDLARSLGYPQSWHVVRVLPHPAELDEDGDDAAVSSTNNSFMDTIYAGDPSSCVDVYYNHSAALGAAIEWKDGESTGYDNRGGQMLPRVPIFQKDSWVEVYYPDEDTWYKAQIKKVKQYVDDIRYTVYYLQEDATQVVSEDLLRAYNPPPSKKRKRATSTAERSSTPSKTKPTSSKETKRPDKASSQKDRRKELFEKFLSNLSQEEILSRKKMAKDIGLPNGWLAYRNTNYIFDIRNPQGERYTSKKAAFDSLQNQQTHVDEDKEMDEEEVEDVKMPKRVKRSSPEKKEEGEEVAKREGIKSSSQDDGEASSIEVEDEGDPPFRKTGHKYLGRTVKYKHYPQGEDGIEIVQCGIVKGWLDSSDIDSNGDPAFISELTGAPGVLFHIVFKAEKQLNKRYRAEMLLDYVDIEQWELEEFFDASD
jgi:hypothetical protein